MQVGSFEARNQLSALLDEVERGAEIVITRRGKPVARLVPATPGFDREKARGAAAGLREIGRTATLGGIRIRELIEDGRDP
ncbi:MAG: type II toxin-antitoxin system prevent-host-death family antitoxin [Alphaproteobacteria bacterium]|nr:type II toxin-antitoxin system prevent-host-death family antitoxin [Alphaproteobacteria bacterium]